MLYEKDELQFTLKMTEENDIEVKLKVEEKPKLEWQNNPPPQPMTWNETTEYIQSLGEDWRLPTISELKDYPNREEKNKDVRRYWTSNVNANGEYNAIGVSFGFGDVGYYGSTNNYHVRCVRHKLK